MLASTDNTSDCSILTVGDRIKIGGRTWPVKAKITTPGQRLASYALSMVIRLSQAPIEYVPPSPLLIPPPARAQGFVDELVEIGAVAWLEEFYTTSDKKGLITKV